MICVLNGQPRAGKSLFVQYCKEVAKDNMVFEYSTVDFVKLVAAACGWDGQKTPKDRKFLSDLKQLLTDWGDVPFKKTLAYIDEIGRISSNAVVFIHCREPKEIQRFVDHFGNDCVTLLIRRDAVESNNQSNASDANVLDFDYDLTIFNNGTFEDLMNEAQGFIKMFFGEAGLR